MDTQLKQLLEEYKSYFSVNESGKVECVNGHCFPANFVAVSAFVKGAKFQKLKQRVDAEAALSKYEPFIIKSKNFPTMLYCQLTGQLIDQSLDAVQRHMKGKRFTSASERYRSDQIELKPEPDIDTLPGIVKSGPPRVKRSKAKGADTSMADAEAAAESELLEEEEGDEVAENSGAEEELVDGEEAGTLDMDLAMEEAAAADAETSDVPAAGCSTGTARDPGGFAAGEVGSRRKGKKLGRKQGRESGNGAQKENASTPNSTAGAAKKQTDIKKKHVGRPAAAKKRRT